MSRPDTLSAQMAPSERGEDNEEGLGIDRDCRFGEKGARFAARHPQKLQKSRTYMLVL